MTQLTEMAVLELFLATLVVFWTTVTADQSKLNTTRTKPNLVEDLLRREDVKQIMSIKFRGGSNFMPLESRQYKCQILNTLYRTARRKYPDLPNGILSPRMKGMLENCTREFRVADFFSQPFIFPGTNWCGQGNIAENYHHLGVFNATDACCREHDYCDDIIRPGKTKHNLVNPYGTTRLHCKCDDALRLCFRNVGSVIANTIGYVFFSLLQTQCYDLDFPTTGCLMWRRGAVRNYCVKYQIDETLSKTWQWFDQEPYI